MFIIKNRVNGEYDRRGSYNTFDKIKRGAWDKIGHAKNHVNMRVSYWNGVNHKILAWYLDADFIEIDENGIVSTIPVSQYLHDYYATARQANSLTAEERKRLCLEEVNA